MSPNPLADLCRIPLAPLLPTAAHYSISRQHNSIQGHHRGQAIFFVLLGLQHHHFALGDRQISSLSKLYVPSNIDTDYIFWQLQLIVDVQSILTQNWVIFSLLCESTFNMDTPKYKKRLHSFCPICQTTSEVQDPFEFLQYLGYKTFISVCHELCMYYLFNYNRFDYSIDNSRSGKFCIFSIRFFLHKISITRM